MTLLPVRLRAMQHISLQCPVLLSLSLSHAFFYPLQEFLHFKNRNRQEKEARRPGNGWQEDMMRDTMIEQKRSYR